MDVKAKVDELFEKFPFLKQIKRHSAAPFTTELENYSDQSDESLTSIQQQLKDNFPRFITIYKTQLIYP